MLVRIGCQDIVQLDVNKADCGIRREAFVVDDLDSNDCIVLGRDQELRTRFPHWVVVAFEGGSLENRLASQVDASIRIAFVACSPRVELLGLV